MSKVLALTLLIIICCDLMMVSLFLEVESQHSKEKFEYQTMWCVSSLGLGLGRNCDYNADSRFVIHFAIHTVNYRFPIHFVIHKSHWFIETYSAIGSYLALEWDV
jgi:hypothetical protein